MGHDAERILPTIISRTQLVKVPALSADDVAQAPPGSSCRKRRRAIGRRSVATCSKRMHGRQERGGALRLFRDWLRARYASKVNDAVEFSQA